MHHLFTQTPAADLKIKCEELEKFKFVLDAKIKELNSEVEPREVEIEALKGQIAVVNAELAASHAQNKSKDTRIGAIRAEIQETSTLLGHAGAKVKERETALKSFERDLYNLVTAMGSRAVDAIGVAKKLAHAHAPKGGLTVSSNLDLGVIAESVRQQQHLTELSKSLRKMATSKGLATMAANSTVGPTDAPTLISENTAIISQINSLKDVIKKIRSETTHLLFGGAQIKTGV